MRSHQLSTFNDYVGIYKIKEENVLIEPGDCYEILHSDNDNASLSAYELALSTANTFDKKVMILSSEHTVKEAAIQILKLYSEIDQWKAEEGWKNHFWKKLKNYAIELLPKNICLYYAPDMSVKFIITSCLRAIEKDGLDLLIIDSLERSGKKVEGISTLLLEFCREFDIAIFICRRDVLPDEDVTHSQDSHLRRLNIHMVL